jgi:hypothetical protein
MESAAEQIVAEFQQGMQEVMDNLEKAQMAFDDLSGEALFDDHLVQLGENRTQFGKQSFCSVACSANHERQAVEASTAANTVMCAAVWRASRQGLAAAMLWCG